MQAESQPETPPERLSRLLKQRVVLAATLLVVLSLILIASLLLHIARQQDEHAADQASALIHAGLERRREAIARSVKDYAAWGEAYQHLHVTTDVDWAFTQRNLGNTLFEDLGYDDVAVVGPAGNVTYAMVEGRLARALAPELSSPALAVLVKAARDAPAGESVPAVGFLSGATAPLLVAATAITTGGNDSIALMPGPPSVLVFADRLTPERLDEVGRQSLVQGFRTADVEDWTTLPAALALATAEGKASVAFTWEPETPGTAILRAVLPWLLVTGLAFALLIVVIVRRMLGAALVIERKSRALGEAHRRMEHAALHDAVTRLPNRMLLDRFLSEALREPGRARGIAVIFIDLDRFKPINDALGHRAGDGVLEAIGERLKNFPQPNELVARVGGDEFVLVVRRSRSSRAIEQLCDAVRQAVRAPIDVEGTTVRVGLSMGVAFGPTDGQSAAELLRHADIAMYAAKARGGDGFVMFSPSMTSAAPAPNLGVVPSAAPRASAAPPGDPHGQQRLRSAVRAS